MMKKTLGLCVAWLMLVACLFTAEYISPKNLIIGHVSLGMFGVLGILFFGIKQNAFYETMQKLVVIDALTGIHNHRAFMEQILTEFKRNVRDGNPLSCIMIDVDFFKTCNDTYGHAAGDDCLKKVALAIKGAIQRPGDFCARYGGDEFVVLLPDTEQVAALFIAESIRSNVEQIKIPRGTTPSSGIVTISLGVATASGATTDSYEEVLRQSDMALYAAKENGRNRVETSGAQHD